MSAEDYRNEISSTVPWHVNKNCVVIVDFERLKSRLDVTIDCWSWILSKTYIVSGDARDGAFRKGNVKGQYRIIKRVYKCKTACLEKCIVTRCKPNVNATGAKNPFLNCEQYAIITYKFMDGERNIDPDNKTRV